MKTRIMSAIIAVPILLWFILQGGLPFATLVLFLTVIGVYEFYRMVAHRGHYFLFIPMLLASSFMTIAMYCKLSSWASIGIIFGFLCIFSVAILRYPAMTTEDIGVNFLGLIYVGWTMPHLIGISSLEEGGALLLYLFFAIWSSDSGAYFVGKFLGAHKLAPKVSPNKTIEGSIGGLVTTVVILIALNSYLDVFQLYEVVLLAVVVSIVGQIGDLIESLLKRFCGIKDSGKLIPGHGGILDRFDSIMLAAPCMYYCILLVQCINK